MSRKLIDHSPDLSRLRAEGFEIQVRENFLLISSVPYLDKDLKLRYGTLACELTHLNNLAYPPASHPMWWQGEYPHYSDGTSIEAFRNPSPGITLLSGFEVNYCFSANPSGPGTIATGYADFYDKVKTYTGIIAGPALQLYPYAVLKTERVFPDDDDDSPFLYPDTNSSRAQINAISDKVKNQKIAIIGTGGTGSYILDLVAKTSVKEIHIFDGDPFGQHNSFRTPGAASPDEVDAKMKKVAYLKGIYSKMRKGIIPNDFNITPDKLFLLDSMDFVFIAIDKSGIKQALFDYLIEHGIAFIDVGIGVTRGNDAITATARVTAANSRKHDHLSKRIPLGPDDDKNDPYHSNIQIAEINAINAAVAVIHWKRQFGFYENTEQSMHVQISVDGLKIFNADDPT